MSTGAGSFAASFCTRVASRTCEASWMLTVLASAGCAPMSTAAATAARTVAARLCAMDMIGILHIRADPRGPAAPSSVYDAVTPVLRHWTATHDRTDRSCGCASNAYGEGCGTTHLILGLTPTE